MWLSRALITLALIDGGLGLQLAGQSKGACAAYDVVCFGWPGLGLGLGCGGSDGSEMMDIEWEDRIEARIG